MTGRRAIVGLCMLCALLVSAFAAQSASAVTKGTTGTAPAGTGYTGKITGSGGETLLHSVISGIEVELKSTELGGTGEVESMLAGTGEHTSNGTGTIEYKGVTVVKPSGKGCAVKTGQVITEKLKASTASQGMGLKFEPNGATPFAKFEVEGCGTSEALKALNGVYEVTGSVIGTPTEGTNETVFERVPTTEQGTLKLRGQKAGIKGVLKLTTSPGGEALKSSTVETP
jgi:hypothetical protein